MPGHLRDDAPGLISLSDDPGEGGCRSRRQPDPGIVLGDKRADGEDPPVSAWWGCPERPRSRMARGCGSSPCRGVHTLGMRYPIDVAFLDARRGRDRDPGGASPEPDRPRLSGCTGALELRSGIHRRHRHCPGDRLEFGGAGRLDTIGRRLLHYGLALSLPEC